MIKENQVAYVKYWSVCKCFKMFSKIVGAFCDLFFGNLKRFIMSAICSSQYVLNKGEVWFFFFHVKIPA